jgi:hypothetical protein
MLVPYLHTNIFHVPLRHSFVYYILSQESAFFHFCIFPNVPMISVNHNVRRTKHLSLDSWCPGRDLTRVPPEHKSRVLPVVMFSNRRVRFHLSLYRSTL